MIYLLDTNICVYAMKRKPPEVLHRLCREQVGDVGISAITYCELEYGVANSTRAEENRTRLEEFIAPLEIMSLAPQIAPVYGVIKAQLRRAGTLVGPLDLLIAAHALYLDVTVVTNNIGEFSRVPGLRVESWVSPYVDPTN